MDPPSKEMVLRNRESIYILLDLVWRFYRHVLDLVHVHFDLVLVDIGTLLFIVTILIASLITSAEKLA